ncbi:MAG: hypothetical protein NTX25_13290 [Proteobacteria bacterium]|nr:hypothetical protein [Pseudomonadota bacterium]
MKRLVVSFLMIYSVFPACRSRSSDPPPPIVRRLGSNAPVADDANLKPAVKPGIKSVIIPFCGETYFGTSFDCNGKKCAKSDAELSNSCEITPNSKPAETDNNELLGSSGYPYCPTKYFGTEYDCGDKKCAKSDSDYLKPCEIKAAATPIQTAPIKTAPIQTAPIKTGTGLSGYPYCPPTHYGSVFTCGPKTCAKSDKDYLNICELP